MDGAEAFNLSLPVSRSLPHLSQERAVLGVIARCPHSYPRQSIQGKAVTFNTSCIQTVHASLPNSNSNADSSSLSSALSSWNTIICDGDDECAKTPDNFDKSPLLTDPKRLRAVFLVKELLEMRNEIVWERQQGSVYYALDRSPARCTVMPMRPLAGRGPNFIDLNWEEVDVYQSW